MLLFLDWGSAYNDFKGVNQGEHMSRLIDKIKKQSEQVPVPMGFRRTQPQEAAPSILLIARVNADAAGSISGIIPGADAVLFSDETSQLTAAALKKITKNLKDVPLGLFLEESKETTSALEEAGFDFIVISPMSPVKDMPKNEKTGKIIQVDSSMDDGILHAVNDLPADAALVTDTFGEGDTLVWHHLMLLRHIALLISKPLIVPVPAAITENELKALWDAGVEAVLVPVDISKGENLKDLHDTAAKLPRRKPKKQGKMNVFLPRQTETKEAPPPEEPEEDE
jgi:hypothetical protein